MIACARDMCCAAVERTDAQSREPFRRSAALPWNGAKGTNLGVVFQFHREKGPAAGVVRRLRCAKGFEMTPPLPALGLGDTTLPERRCRARGGRP